MQQLPDNNRRFTRENFRKSRGEKDGTITGIFLVIIGAAFLLNRAYPELPNWLFSWKTLLITVGLYVGVKHNFRGGGWAIPIIIGGIFLFMENFPDLAIKRYIWPIAIIVVGLIIILKPRFGKSTWTGDDDYSKDPLGNNKNSIEEKSANWSQEDIIDTTNIFSGSKKINLSKNFRGGEVTNIFGGSEINLTKADLQGTAVLEVTCIFGGTKLIVPPDWNIQQEAVAIFGGVDDKRPVTGLPENPSKTLIIKGTVLMGGIDIRSY
ncbi:MAG: hypothetical protein EOP53_14180 [Sphingobacteriales bacterium]|nr:MAG: hypothetical protein EOP53_14180 [Sphingobacteriales bacterium]